MRYVALLALTCAALSLPRAAKAQSKWTAVANGTPVAYCNRLWTPSQDVVWLLGDINDRGGLYRSTDGGAHFESISVPGRFHALVTIDDKRLFGLGSDEKSPYAPYVIYSEDAGKNWQRRGTIYDKSTARNASLWTKDGQHLLVALELHGIFESTDGGQAWKQLRPKVQDADLGNGQLLLATDADTFDLYRSTDGGKMFALSLKSNSAPAAWPPGLRSPWMVNDKLGFVGVPPTKSMMRTKDGAMTWQAYALPQIMGAAAVVHQLAFATDGLNGVASVEDGMQKDIRILSTKDGGDTWAMDQLPKGMLDNGALRVPGCFSYRPDGSVLAGSITAYPYPLFYRGGDGSGAPEPAAPAAGDAGVRDAALADAGSSADAATADAAPTEETDASDGTSSTPEDEASKSDGGCSAAHGRESNRGGPLLLLACLWLARRRPRRHARRA
jgi:photosystem II stability/assembly factor-like uncharacterized protein